MLRNAFFYTALLGVAAYALTRGGGPERAVALLFLTAAVATILVLPSQAIFHNVATGILLVDSALFAGLLAVSIRAERFWPLWMTALQGIAVAGHGAKAVNPHVIPFAYAVLLVFWGYPMVALLGVATWRHQHRLKKYGTDRSWTRSWLPFRDRMPDGGAKG
jgi:hypothetical protein